LTDKEDVEKLDVVLHRLFFLIKEYLEEFEKSMGKEFGQFHVKSYDYHDQIARFTNYYLRLLQRSSIPDAKKGRLFSLLVVVDKMMDKVRHASDQVEERHPGKPVHQRIKGIFDLFLEQFEMIMNMKLTPLDVEDIVKRRYRLVQELQKVKFTLDELRVMSEVVILLDTSNDFTETYVALHVDETHETRRF